MVAVGTLSRFVIPVVGFLPICVVSYTNEDGDELEFQSEFELRGKEGGEGEEGKERKGVITFKSNAWSGVGYKKEFGCEYLNPDR